MEDSYIQQNYTVYLRAFFYRTLHFLFLLILLCAQYGLCYSDAVMKIEFFSSFFFIAIIYYPGLLSVMDLCFVSIVQDLFSGMPLGLHIVQNFAFALFLTSRREKIQVQPFGVQIVAFGAFYACYALCSYLANAALAHAWTSVFAWRNEWLGTLLFYPCVLAMMHFITKRGTNGIAH